MKEVRECPICDWKHEAEPPKVPPEALASVFGPGVMSMVAMQQHAQDIERALDAHFRTHSTLDWVRATVRLRDKNAALAKELRATDEAMGDYTVNIIRSLPEAAAKLRAEVERLKANAERYQWMKRVHADGDESVTAWIGYYPADQWDAEIDKHRADNEGAQRNE